MRKNNPLKTTSHDLYLGIDGGGTKTHALILNAERKIIAEGFSGPSNPLRVGAETAVGNIRAAVVAACDSVSASPSDIVCASIGLAGVRRSDLREQIRTRIGQKLGFKKVTVVTDAEIALYGTTQGKPGLVIISGTGSICLGKDKNGNVATAGGWGPIAGDEGGGSSIAKQALQAIAKDLDGRGRETKLKDVAADYFRASTPEDLIVAIYSPQMDNRKIAGFARYVIETAKEDDEIAVEILSVAGFELGLAANAVIKKLKMTKKKVPIGTVGSIFNAGELLTKPLLDTVYPYAPKAFLVKPELRPAHAAAIMSFNEYCK